MGLESEYANSLTLTVIPPATYTTQESNVPVMVRIGRSAGKYRDDTSDVFEKLGASYLKMAVSLDDGVTECPVEVTEWDVDRQLGILFVKIPSVPTTGMTLKLWYDSTHDDNTTNVGAIGSAVGQSVWANGFEGVWHMKNSGGLVLDSTANANHGTIHGATEVDGPLGRCLSFDGVDDRVVVPNHIALNPSGDSFTFGLVCKIRSGATASGHSYWMCPIEKRTVGPGGYYVGFETRTTGWRFMLTSPPRTDTPSNPDTIYTGAVVDVRAMLDRVANTQSILVFNLDTGTIHGPQITTPSEGAIVDNGPLYIGGGSTFPHDGDIYLVQLERCVRSPAWIALTNASLKDELIAFSTPGTESLTGNERMRLMPDGTLVADEFVEV